jgi:hypothetical protein
MGAGHKKSGPQVEVGVSPHDGLTQSHEGRNMQDPRGGKVVQL